MRTTKTTKGLRQLLVRITPETDETLRMAALFVGCSSVQELVAPAVEEFAAAYAKDPKIREALRLKDEYQQAHEAAVLPMQLAKKSGSDSSA